MIPVSILSFYQQVTSLLARFSGITAKMLRPITTSLGDVQVKLQSLLPADAVLVGHSVNNDLKALKVGNLLDVHEEDN